MSLKLEDTATMAELFQMGADMEAKDSRGYTPLQTAVFLGKHQLFPFLLHKMGSNINAKCRDKGNTALHIAVEQGALLTLGLLLFYGADLNITNNEGHSPITLAAVMENKQALKLLQQFREKGIKALASILEDCDYDFEVAKTLFDEIGLANLTQSQLKKIWAKLWEFGDNITTRLRQAIPLWNRFNVLL